VNFFKRIAGLIVGPQTCAWYLCRKELPGAPHVFYDAKFCNRYCAKAWFLDLQTEARRMRDLAG
jgi:hypothetical protein